MERPLTDLSWGHFPHPRNQSVHTLTSREERWIQKAPSSYLPRGMGRSYGDSCLISEGTLLSTRYLDHLLDFDEQTGVLTAEAGVTIENVIRALGPRGWFVPVTPGTKFVTLGGAVANDVHGKNHHVAGSFGRHVLELELLRSTGERITCSREQDAPLFHATIGGLGLTGLILSVKFRLIQVKGPFIEQETLCFENLDQFFELSRMSNNWPYTVAWVSAPQKNGDIAGVFFRGQHSEKSAPTAQQSATWYADKRKINIPFDMPNWTVNRFSVALLNFAYGLSHRLGPKNKIVHFDPFFYPLDSILNWNRMYGRRGFVQYQFVLPDTETGRQCLRQIFIQLAHAPVGSFLSVLKTFGHFRSEGLLSFPRPGITLAMDFPVSGDELFRLLDVCDRLVMEAEGALYPAKDSRMSKEIFSRSFPRLEEFQAFIDPAITSDFWRRVL